ncbi:hypothetical protein ACVIGA_005942 [Bradyrhizobium sp. USDA 3240]
MRIRTRRGHQIAAVAVARKLTVLCWHLLTKSEDYLWAHPALVANKTRAMQLQAGHPQQKGNRRGPAYACNIKALRDCEMLIAAQADQSYDSCRNGSRVGQKPARGRLSWARQNRQSGPKRWQIGIWLQTVIKHLFRRSRFRAPATHTTDLVEI